MAHNKYDVAMQKIDRKIFQVAEETSHTDDLFIKATGDKLIEVLTDLWHEIEDAAGEPSYMKELDE